MAEHWNRHDDADRAEFARYLQPLVTASRTQNFTRAEASVYLITLRDVPKDVLALGVTRLIEQGITWMPKPGDIKAVCVSVVKERRSVASKKAAELKADCIRCDGSGWERIEQDGVEHVKRCWCVTRGLELVAEAGEPLALPAHTESEDVA